MVKYFRKISVKKPSALLFMAMMIFINGIKLFHTHHDSDNSSSRSSTSSFTSNSCFSLHQVTQDKHCPICEFNLMKDADMAHSDIPFFIRVTGNAVFTNQLPQSLHQFSILSKGRAPPFFLS
jgi:hypothetical protein